MNKISIAMTTYCGEKYILEQLTSLLNQTRKPDEVVIFDDCSKDRTAEVVSRFIKDNHLSNNWHFEVNEENKGFINNFAHAIERATGDIIFLCDQDDVWCDYKIQEMESLFDKHPDAMAINSRFAFVDANGDAIHVSENSKKTNHDLINRVILPNFCEKISCLEVVKSNISPGCTMAFRKELKAIYLSTSRLLVPHDHELNILASIHGELYFYNKEMIKYRIHENNAIGLPTNKKEQTTDFLDTMYHKRHSAISRLYVYQNSLKYINGIDVKGLKHIKYMSNLYMAKKLIYQKKQLRYVVNAVLCVFFVPRKIENLKTVIADFLFMIRYKCFGGRDGN